MLYTQIKEEIKDAMKNKEADRKDVLKMVVDKAKAIIKEKNPSNTGEEIPDDVMIQAIQKEVKQLNQTKESLRGKEDTDLYASTEIKLNVLSKYLPAQMTEQELEEFISKELSVLVSKTKGMAMKTIMPQIKGRADGKLAVKIINRLLK
jgi:hypothetical protein